MSATAGSYRAVVCGVLREVYAPLRNAEKLLSEHSGAAPRTTRNWLTEDHAPHGEHLIGLMAHCDELKQAIDRLVRETANAQIPDDHC